MGKGSIASRFGRVRLLVAAFIVALLVPVATASAVDNVVNPGPFTAQISGGNLKIKDLSVSLDGMEPAPTVTGTIAADGSFTIPPANVVFPDLLLTDADTGAGFDITVKIQPMPTFVWNGVINPLTGAANLNARLRVKLEGGSGLTALGNSCYVANSGNGIELNPATSGTVPANAPAPSLTGTPYNQDSGTTSIVNNVASVPGASGCGLLSLGNGAVNDALGLPSTTGNNEINLQLSFDPKLIGPLRPSFTQDPDSGKAPVVVNFDASASQSDIPEVGAGVIDSYKWDFDNDGNVDDTTAVPTTSHTYDVPGFYTPKLTVTNGSSETSKLGEQIRVEGAITSLDQKPAALSNSTSATFAFSSNENPATFECSFDDSEYEACESPKTYSDLADGTHTFAARATVDGKTGLSTSHEFAIDTVKPISTITSQPAAKVGAEVTSGQVAFSADKEGSTFECRFTPVAEIPAEPPVDPPAEGVFSPCASPTDVSWPVIEGTNKFEVRATDPLGNVGEIVSATWDVDTTKPTTEITTGPANPTNANNAAGAAFTLNSNESGGTFVCQFNDATERPCATGIQTGTGTTGGQERLGDPILGNNTLKVWAVDAAGNRDEVGASYSYVFDNVQPIITLLSQPPAFTNQTTASAVFQSQKAVVRFECRRTASGSSGWATCAPGLVNPTTGKWDATAETAGAKVLQVRGVDAAGNVSSGTNVAQANWTTDFTPPTVSITGGPAELTNTNVNTATMSFTANEANSTFQCRLNAASTWTACVSPMNLTGLPNGLETFRVRAFDPAGNVSNDPAIRTWNVGAASVTISGKPVALSPVNTATFQFSPDVAAECRLDATDVQRSAGTGYTACNTGKNYTGLANGSHTVEIRATGSAFPAVYTWIVDTTPPAASFTARPGISRPSGYFTGLDTESSSIAFGATNPNGAVTYQCRYYESTATPPPYDACTSPAPVSWDKNDDGVTMKFDVLPTSPSGNTGPVQSVTWTIDSTKPEVSLNAAVACANGTAAGDCVSTANSDKPAVRSNVTAPQFRATSTQPITGATGFACQLNEGTIQNPCVARTSSFPAGGNPLTVVLGGSRGNSNNLGTAISQNASNTMKIWAVDNGGNMSDPVSYTWVHDNTAPTVTYTSSNPARTNTNSLAVAFESNEDVQAGAAGFRCRVNASPSSANPSGWANCPTISDSTHAQWLGTDLAEGNYTMDVKAYDAIGNASTSGNGARYSFAIDRTAPTSNVTAGPSEEETVGTNSPTFEFSTGDPADQIVSYQCRLDPIDPPDAEDPTEGWSDCVSPVSYTELADGAHVFQVRALDTAGNQEVGGATRNWTIDSTPPGLTVQNNLNGAVTNQTAATFNITTVPEDSTIECRLIAPGDDEELVEWDDPCDVQQVFTGLTDGNYKFQVRATNGIGVVSGVDSTPWRVDTVAPDISIGSGPDAPVNATTAEFGFSSTSGDVASFECQLDEDTPAACTNPKSYSSLGDGDHVFKVLSIDQAGNRSPRAIRSWSVDTVVPVASITSGPTGSTEAKTAAFEFNSDKADSTFECKLDGGEYGACESPKSYTGVAKGAHTFSVKATDTVGNVSAATTREWTVTEPEVCPTGTTGTPPDCAPVKCPTGQVGTPPDCHPDVCPVGTTGTPPNCLTEQPGAAVLAKPTAKSAKKLKSGKALKITTTVKNTGESSAAGVKVCLKTPKKLVKGKGSRCKTVSVAAGKATTVKFTVKTKKMKAGKKKQLNYTVSAAAPGLPKPKNYVGHVTLMK